MAQALDLAMLGRSSVRVSVFAGWGSTRVYQSTISIYFISMRGYAGSSATGFVPIKYIIHGSGLKHLCRFTKLGKDRQKSKEVCAVS
jgi:hypothetical protein